MRNIELDIQDVVGYIIINEKILSLDDIIKINEYLDIILKNDEIKCIIFKSNNTAFSYGFDLKSKILIDEPDKVFIAGSLLTNKIAHAKCMTIALVNGACIGGGFEIALACDIIYAYDGAYFGFGEMINNLIPGWNGFKYLLNHTTYNYAAEMIISGETILAKRAYEIGIVNRIINKDNDKFINNIINNLYTISYNTIRFSKDILSKANYNKENDIEYLKYFIELAQNLNNTNINKLS